MNRRADRRDKLGLLRHRFSIYIPHADNIYENLHIVLDDSAELKYAVNKAAVIGDDHTMKESARFVFALGEGETKTFAWVTADGIKECYDALMRDDEIPVLFQEGKGSSA